MKIRYLNRDVGFLRSDGVFVTHRNEEHIFRKFGGIGISFEVLLRLKRLGCYKIVILLHKHNGDVERFVSSPIDFINMGVFYGDGGYSQKVMSFVDLKQKKLEEVKSCCQQVL